MQALRRPSTALATTVRLRRRASLCGTCSSSSFESLLLAQSTCFSFSDDHNHHRHRIQRRHATSRARKEKKSDRALVRARRLQQESMATVVDAEEWSGSFNWGAMKQGLKELDGPEDGQRQGEYAAKPLMANTSNRRKRDSEKSTKKFMTTQEVWAMDIQGAWNEILHADATSASPRISIPGFPIEVVQVIASRDLGHLKVFWEISENCNPSPAVERQVEEAFKQGHDPELVVRKTIAQLLEKRQGMLRTRLAQRFPMKRVPAVMWLHASMLNFGEKWELDDRETPLQ